MDRCLQVEPFVRTLQFEVDKDGTIVRAHRHGSAPCGAASFIGMPLAEAVAPVGVSAGPTYHGVLGGHLPCQYAFTAGLRYYTVDVHLNVVSRSRAPKGCFATFDRTIEIVERLEGLECAILVSAPTPILPETRSPGRNELCIAQDYMHDRLGHPLSIVTLLDDSIVAVLPRLDRRILESKFVAFEEDCRTILSARFAWTAGLRFERPPCDLRQTVTDCIARSRAAAWPRKSA